MRAEAGDPAMGALRDSGIADEVRAAHEWTSRNRVALETGIRLCAGPPG
ncbi:hypothetical protein [Actinoplanes italicus]|nr:hypothetical protein [Actinoplanes italicus]